LPRAKTGAGKISKLCRAPQSRQSAKTPVFAECFMSGTRQRLPALPSVFCMALGKAGNFFLHSLFFSILHSIYNIYTQSNFKQHMQYIHNQIHRSNTYISTQTRIIIVHKVYKSSTTKFTSNSK
jgi:hypothetical protein